MDRTRDWLDVRERGRDSGFWLESEIWVPFIVSQNMGVRTSLGKGNEFNFESEVPIKYSKVEPN